MQHLVLYFRHETQDIIPYSTAVKRIRQLLAETGVGEYVEDDMSIDGGDPEAIMQGPSADTIFATISPVLKELKLLRSAKITLAYGPLSAGAKEKTFLVVSENAR